MTPLVSVVIRTQNRAVMLAQALDSVFAQTMADFEVVVVDDGSTDGTRDDLARLGPRVVPVLLPRTGNPARLLNVGIRTSRGALVAFLDSDDLWLPTKLERQVDLLAADARFGFAYGNARVLDADGRLSPPGLAEREMVSGSVLKAILRNMCVHPSTVLVRREWFDRVGTFDEERPVSEDLFFFLRLARATDAVCAREPVAVIRRHPGQLSRALGLDTYRAAVTAFEELRADPTLPLDVRVAVHRAIARHHAHLAKHLILDGNRREGRRHALAAFRRDPLFRPAWRWLVRGVIG